MRPQLLIKTIKLIDRIIGKLTLASEIISIFEFGAETLI
jgi:hypothetical protein